MTTTTEHTTERDLRDALDRMNQAGRTPELAAVDAKGNPFLATLTEPDADMAIITSGEDGHATGRFSCPECGASGPVDWTPTYPVVTLGGAE